MKRFVITFNNGDDIYLLAEDAEQAAWTALSLTKDEGLTIEDISYYRLEDEHGENA